MTTALAHTHVLSGLCTQPVRVEADLANGLPQFSIVGLPSTAVREARDRVRAALVNAGFGFPDRRVTVNLAPADLPKDSGRFDLAIALAILAAYGKIPASSLKKWVLAGELSLSGELLPIRAAFAFGLSVVRGLPAAESASNFSDQGPSLLMAPSANATEFALLDAESRIVCVANLADACDVVCGRRGGASPRAVILQSPRANGHSVQAHGHAFGQDPARSAEHPQYPPDAPSGLRWESVRGQAAAQRAAMVAAAGSHSLLLMGPPGVGKSMIAERLVTLLPPLSRAEAQEVLALQSLESAGGTVSMSAAPMPTSGSGMGQSVQGQKSNPDPQPEQPVLWRRPPFRAPHHTTSAKALIGGGNPIRPGEISLAHRGVLFLDELPEFSRDALESLREPLQTGEIRIVRVRDRQTLPSRVLLVAAMNPCPCGFYGVKASKRACRCTADQVSRYQGRLSGPLLDRFDLAVLMQSQSAATESAAAQLGSGRSGKGDTNKALPPALRDTLGLEASTEERQEQVARARERAVARQGCPNAQLSAEALEKLGLLAPEADQLLAQVAERTDMSLRVVERLRRVAITLADLSGADRAGLAEMAQAIDLRRGLDRPAALAG
ncbi:MAG: YifB family Mg chelatase-like AAA ATPase [Burkholderiaceae bacterium]